MRYAIEITNADSLCVEFFADSIHDANQQALRLAQLVEKKHPEYIVDLVPSYTSLTIFVDFPALKPQSLITDIEDILITLNNNTDSKIGGHTSSTHLLPCCYDDSFGLDILRLCTEKNIDKDELIALHTQTQYQVFALGFSPGFPFLGKVNARIAMPRLATPRKQVAAGSVGIADRQTGIYPHPSPGGWNIIGRCPLPLFNKPSTNKEQQLCRLQVGDKVQFKRIDREEFYALYKDNRLD